MTSSKWYDTRAEAEAFIEGLRISGRYEWIEPRRMYGDKWEVKYWSLWR